MLIKFKKTFLFKFGTYNIKFSHYKGLLDSSNIVEIK